MASDCGGRGGVGVGLGVLSGVGRGLGVLGAVLCLEGAGASRGDG